MITKVGLRSLPSAAGNRLYVDYVTGSGTAASFFTHAPLDFGAAFKDRREYNYPRAYVSRRLAEYNQKLGAHPAAMANIETLDGSSAFCVITGQQAGFLGGPVYTAYKIITAIRLAKKLQEELGVIFVPMLWLATEDHDFGEINHAFWLKDDGEVGRVRFSWEHEGRPISDLPVTAEVRQACDEYCQHVFPSGKRSALEELFSPREGENFSTWNARTWSQLFSRHGLVIVEPRILRGGATDFLSFAMEHTDDVEHRLADVSQRLVVAGYKPWLTPAQSGRLFTLDPMGRRVRTDDSQEDLRRVREHPELYSTDAALRPLFADSMLPVIVSVLGPGETAYQAMLRPLYDLFDLPQPLLFPRKSYTIAAQGEAERLGRYGVDVVDVLTERLEVDAVMRGLTPPEELEMFDSASRGLKAALSPLRSYVGGVDPTLDKSWAQTLARSQTDLDKLAARVARARLSRLGLSRGEVRALSNSLLPRGRLQERVFPLPHFLNRYGTELLEELLKAGRLDDFSHHVLTLEERDV